MCDLTPVAFCDPVGLPWAAASENCENLYITATMRELQLRQLQILWEHLIQFDAHHINKTSHYLSI